jgi:hypothetical protein
MENLHILPTDKPSRLCINGKNQMHIYITSDEEIKEGDWFLLDMSHSSHPNEVHQMGHNKWSKTGGINFSEPNSWTKACKKIILTTDQDLIVDDVQSIDDEFLEWFVKNPSCEEVEVEEVYPLTCCIQKEGKTKMNNGCMERNRCLNYKTIIPQEEPKQETLEEAAERIFEIYSNNTSLAEGHYDYMMDKEDFKEASLEIAKFQAERMYSEEEVRQMLWELGDALFNNCQEGIEEGEPETYFDIIINEFKKTKDGK